MDDPGHYLGFISFGAPPTHGAQTPNQRAESLKHADVGEVDIMSLNQQRK
jgi:hypothetical protein